MRRTVGVFRSRRPGNAIRAAPAGQDADDRLDQRALAGAVRPEDGDDLTFVDVEIDATERVDIAIGNVEVADLAACQVPR